MKALLAILLCMVLQACGGAGAQTTPVTQSTVTAQTTLPPSGGSMDGYNGGTKSLRDVSGAIGGPVGFVNTAHYAHTISGALETSFEWVSLSVMDNYSQAGENVAKYAQCNAFSTGPCWGGVSEATDTIGTASAVVAHEFDTFVTGSDNGSRIGLEVVSGDAKYIRSQVKSEAHATTAIRIGQTTSTPWATWQNGIVLTGNFRDSAIKLVNPAGVVVFEVKPNGDIYRRGVLLP